MRARPIARVRVRVRVRVRACEGIFGQQGSGNRRKWGRQGRAAKHAPA